MAGISSLDAEPTNNTTTSPAFSIPLAPGGFSRRPIEDLFILPARSLRRLNTSWVSHRTTASPNLPKNRQEAPSDDRRKKSPVAIEEEDAVGTSRDYSLPAFGLGNANDCIAAPRALRQSKPDASITHPIAPTPRPTLSIAGLGTPQRTGGWARMPSVPMGSTARSNSCPQWRRLFRRVFPGPFYSRHPLVPTRSSSTPRGGANPSVARTPLASNHP